MTTDDDETLTIVDGVALGCPDAIARLQRGDINTIQAVNLDQAYRMEQGAAAMEARNDGESTRMSAAKRSRAAKLRRRTLGDA
jgi:hypothetical protein